MKLHNYFIKNNSTFRNVRAKSLDDTSITWRIGYKN